MTNYPRGRLPRATDYPRGRLPGVTNYPRGRFLPQPKKRTPAGLNLQAFSKFYSYFYPARASLLLKSDLHDTVLLGYRKFFLGNYITLGLVNVNCIFTGINLEDRTASIICLFHHTLGV